MLDIIRTEDYTNIKEYEKYDLCKKLFLYFVNKNLDDVSHKIFLKIVSEEEYKKNNIKYDGLVFPNLNGNYYIYVLDKPRLINGVEDTFFSIIHEIFHIFGRENDSKLELSVSEFGTILFEFYCRLYFRCLDKKKGFGYSKMNLKEYVENRYHSLVEEVGIEDFFTNSISEFYSKKIYLRKAYLNHFRISIRNFLIFYQLRTHHLEYVEHKQALILLQEYLRSYKDHLKYSNIFRKIFPNILIDLKNRIFQKKEQSLTKEEKILFGKICSKVIRNFTEIK